MEAIDKTKKRSIINIKDAVNLWVEHRSSGGEVYFYNPKTRITSWSKPENVEIIDQATYEASALQLLKNRCDTINATSAPAATKTVSATTCSGLSVQEVEGLRCELSAIEKAISTCQMQTSEWSVFANENGRKYYFNQANMCTQWEEPNCFLEINRLTLRASEVRRKLTHPLGSGKQNLLARPIAKSVIPASPWCLVWTSHGRYFFHNPSKKLSVWARPSELIDQYEVDDLICDPPEEIISYLEDLKQNGENNETQPNLLSEQRRVSDQESVISNEQRTTATRADKNNLNFSERSNIFKDMLIERKVSVYSNWSSEIHKIASDARYTILNAKERKAVFDEFVEERKAEEKLERVKDIERRQDEFRHLLLEAQLKPGSIFADFCARFGRDERFRRVVKMRDREQLFNEFLNGKIEKLQEEANEMRKPFFEFLDNYFEDACADSFNALNWNSFKDKIESDDRRFVKAGAMRSIWFAEYVKLKTKELSLTCDQKDKKQRMVDSLKKREEQVKSELRLEMKALHKTRDFHLKRDAMQIASDIFANLVTDDHVEWNDVKSSLKRYDEKLECLSKHEIKDIFYKRIDYLKSKKKNAFKQMLSEIDHIGPDSKWHHIEKLIVDDVRYKKYSSSDKKREKEFRNYILELCTKAKHEFKELLKETKFISYDTLTQLQNGSITINDIESYLKNDKRYLTLNNCAKERDELIMSYMIECKEKGPPPPPTATGDSCNRKP